MTGNDLDLLREFVRDQSQPAFTSLVQRHVDLVYSAALRQVRSPQLAEEVGQGVFIELARQAATLKPNTVLPAWLYQVTRRMAIDVVRRESRRQAREQLAMEMSNMNATASDWNAIEPLLDEATGSLDDTDRAAILLRYFENKPLREVGAFLGMSDDAAQKRVSRAVERLRQFLCKRGVATGTAGLAVVISANAVQAAPIGLVATFAGAALTGTIATTAASTAAKAILMTTAQKTAVGITLLALAGTGLYQTFQTVRLRSQIQALQQQQAPLAEQITQLQRERDDATNRVAALAGDLASRSNNTSELLKLRRQVTELRAGVAGLNRGQTDSVEAAAKSWSDRVAQLKEKLKQTQGAAIPEFKYLTEENWLNAAHDPFVTEEDYRRAFASLRGAGENQFIIQMQKALGAYLKQNGNQFPTDISQLKSYFENPVDDAALQRYAIVPSSTIPNLKMGGQYVITVANPIDKQYDSLWALGPSGFGTTTYNGQEDAGTFDALSPAIKAYHAANNGQDPADPADLLPYLTTPEQQAAYQKLLQKTQR